MKKVLAFISIALFFSCTSEFCEDDCELKFVFTLVNTDTTSLTLRFILDDFYLQKPSFINHPDTAKDIVLEPGSSYTDTLHYRDIIDGYCGCFYHYAKSLLQIHVEEKVDGNYYVYPGCPECKDTLSWADTYPEGKRKTVRDTMYIP